MTDNERDALVERTAKTMVEADIGPGAWDGTLTRPPMPDGERNVWIWRARAALAVIEPAVQEDCALIAENTEPPIYVTTVHAGWWADASEKIAAKIRKAKDTP